MLRSAPILGMFSAALVALPGQAAELESWRFDARDNEVSFTTDASVRPRAQLIFNPTRLVIDLPGVRLAGQRPRQSGSGPIQAVRWGQFDANTARLVVELAPGYTLDPDGVQVEERSPGSWVVQIPDPQPLESQGAIASDSQPIAVQPSSEPSTPTAGPGVAELESIETTDYGFYLRLSGGIVPAELRRERRGRRYILDLPNTVLAEDLESPPEELSQFGIEELSLTQEATDPPLVRLTLRLNEAADWQFNETAAGDVVLQPGRRAERPAEPSPQPSPSEDPSPSPSPTAPSASSSQIQAISFLPDRSALQLRVSGDVAYTVERSGDRYRLRFPNTALGSLPPVDLGYSSRLLDVTWDQDGDEAQVDFAVAADIQVGQPTESNPGFRQRGGDRLITIPLARPFWVPNADMPPVPLPDIGNRQLTVVIDPGHGGRDPGAVGIRGLREVDIVNQVSLRVRDLLQQQGVQVVMTRSDNRNLELEDRVQIAERARAQIFVSIHANAISLSRPDVNGIETFHASAAGRVLAAALLDSLLEATGSPSRGVKSARFYVIRNTSMPSSLVEMGFVTGVEDAPRMETDVYREVLARAIARGILVYIRQNL